MSQSDLQNWSGALLINKHPGVSSFGIIELLQRHLRERYGVKRSQMPKLGHGGTLDPFATGLLVVCVGRAVKLARYFLGAPKSYAGVIRFGETTIPGDPTAPVSERSEALPASLAQLQESAARMAAQPYLQLPPMHSAKKKDGKRLYELAREGLDVEREPKLCHLYKFAVTGYDSPDARFELDCSSGTYVRVLAQDFGRILGSVAMLQTLERTATGPFHVKNAWTVEQLNAIPAGQSWNTLPCWVPFDGLLEGYPRAKASRQEAEDLMRGRQGVLFNILKKAEPVAEKDPRADRLAIYAADRLIAIACAESGNWRIERVFTETA